MLLHPDRALIWPARRTLFIADLHLGKGEIFRRAGIPIPEGHTALDLQRIDAMVKTHELQRVVLLGDFLHGAADAAASHARLFRQWRQERAALEFVVVAGNHDRRSVGRELDDAVQWQVSDWQLGPFVCRHHPGRSLDGFVLSGHVHPVIYLRASHRERTRVPVCWINAHCAVLPAFGSFTGGGEIEPEDEDRLFAFAANRVWRVPGRSC
jgi:DNA ligase-associated metallophosphoesterase